MNSPAHVSAEYAARFLLGQFHTLHPDRYTDITPVNALADWLGLQVETFHASDYPDGTFGFVDPDEEEALIWLRRDLPETLRRFTLAHELGHALLHCADGAYFLTLLDRYAPLEKRRFATDEQLPEPSRADPCQEDDLQLEMMPVPESVQDLVAYDPRSQRELTANLFAAELLMPLERVRSLYLEERKSVREMAAIFGVSQAAMLNQLANLLQSSSTPQTGEEAPAASGGKKQYDKFQQAAIEAATPALIVAGPGSGKTSTLVGRVDYLVRERQVAPSQILALTFSRKAAQEMEERLRGLLSDTNSNELPKVSTFHAFCADLLRNYGALVGLRSNFSLVDEVEGYFILRQQAHQMRLHHLQSLGAPDWAFMDMLKAISRAKDELVTPDQYAELSKLMYEQAELEEVREKAEKTLEIAQVYGIYEEELRRRGDTDFGGLIMLAVQLLREHPQVLQEQQKRYQHILVDEFQDMNRASGVLLRVLAGEQSGVWVVGDNNQAIYAFRGASPANITQFSLDFPGANILPLSRNYRSRPDLIALAEAFRHHKLEPDQPAGKNLPARQSPPGVSVLVAEAADDEYEMAGLVEDIRQKHASGYAYSEIAVLCRTRKQLQRITRALAAEGLPVHERGGLFEQEYIKDLIAIVLLLADPGGMGLLRIARLPDYVVAQSDIELFLQYAREQKVSPRLLLLSGDLPLMLSVEGRRSLERLGNTLRSLQRGSDSWSLLMQYMLEESELARDLLIEESAENRARLADYDALLQLARRSDQQQRQYHQRRVQEANERNEDTPADLSLEELLQSFIEYLNLLRQLRQDGGNRQSAEEEGGENGIIRVMTVHASKGLEFPVIYLPGLVLQNFPARKQGAKVPTPDGLLPPESQGDLAHDIGESCLFYVGVTRAREHLILSYSERKGGFKRSPYLEMLLAGLPVERIMLQQWDATSLKRLQEQPEDELTSVGPGSEFIGAMKPEGLTAGTLKSYQSCPRQYAYSHIYHFSGEDSDYLLFHKTTRKALEEMQRIAQNGEPLPEQQDLQEFYMQQWQTSGGLDSPFSSLYEAHGREIVAAARQRLSIDPEKQQNTRQKFDVEVAGQIVSISIDTVEMSSEREAVRFVRARMGKPKKKVEIDLDDVLATLAYRQYFPGQEAEVYAHYLASNQLESRSISPRMLKGRVEKIEQLIKGLTSDQYPAHPEKSDACQSCPFYWICPL
jgi:superfamily I DNA/RNA helicase/Zn-dependent peptidase ImmA (M78 family)